GTVLVFAQYPAWLPHRGSSGDKNLPAKVLRADQDETDCRLVVNPAAACLRRFRLAKVAHVDTTTDDSACRSREKQERTPEHHKDEMEAFNRIAPDVSLGLVAGNPARFLRTLGEGEAP